MYNKKVQALGLRQPPAAFPFDIRPIAPMTPIASPDHYAAEPCLTTLISLDPNDT